MGMVLVHPVSRQLSPRIFDLPLHQYLNIVLPYGQPSSLAWGSSAPVSPLIAPYYGKSQACILAFDNINAQNPIAYQRILRVIMHLDTTSSMTSWSNKRTLIRRWQGWASSERIWMPGITDWIESMWKVELRLFEWNRYSKSISLPGTENVAYHDLFCFSPTSFFYYVQNLSIRVQPLIGLPHGITISIVSFTLSETWIESESR